MSAQAAAHVSIRRPHDAEGPACRMLVPDHAPTGMAREFLVAAQDSLPTIVGAVSWRRGSEATFSLRLRVLRTHRRLGIGSRLLRQVIDDARERGHRAVAALAHADSEPDAAPFLSAHGFTLRNRLTTVEGEAEPMRAYLVQLRNRLVASGRVPPTARVVPYSDSLREQVARLYAEHIVHNPEAAAAIGAEAGKRVAQSPVLLVGDRVEGALLWSLEGSLATVLVRVVAPAYRGGWANALLLGTGIEQGCAAGAKRVRFEVPGGNSDTLKLAQRFRAETLTAVDHYLFDLKAANPPPAG